MKDETQVLYNGSCPVCSREIRHYARLSEEKALAVGFIDLADSAKLADWGLDADQAAKRLHVRKDGQMYSGIPAFIMLWREIPQKQWLARITRLPGIHWAVCFGYDHVLAPLLYRWHLYREKHQYDGVGPNLVSTKKFYKNDTMS
jgi:predicted DCC family thiol-disulfide oxidoreductase YuxK